MNRGRSRALIWSPDRTKNSDFFVIQDTKTDIETYCKCWKYRKCFWLTLRTIQYYSSSLRTQNILNITSPPAPKSFFFFTFYWFIKHSHWANKFQNHVVEIVDAIKIVAFHYTSIYTYTFKSILYLEMRYVFIRIFSFFLSVSNWINANI